MIGQTNKKILSQKRQRSLRKCMTKAERALWRVLRDRQFMGLKFRRQHPFDDFILDCVCLKSKLVIELDGGQHAAEVEYDETRTQKLEAAGFRVLRFWNNEVLREMDAVKEKIWETLQEIQANDPIPTPTLPLKGREETVASLSFDGEGETQP